MELRHLRYFVALANAPTFTSAAETVHVTQSTLSHQIAQLEEEVGTELFHRIGKRRVVLSHAGQLFLSYAQRALNEMDMGRAMLRSTTLEISGELRVGAGQAFNSTFIQECATRFLARYPSVKLVLEEFNADQIISGLLERHLHVGVSWRPQDLHGLTFEPLHVEELVLAVSPKHPFAERKSIRMVELHRQSLALCTKRYATRVLLDGCFRSCGAEPVIAVEVNSTPLVLSIVANSNLGTIISRFTVTERDDLCVVHLEDPTPTRTPGILWHPVDQPLFVQSFVSYIREAAFDASMSLNSNPGI